MPNLFSKNFKQNDVDYETKRDCVRYVMDRTGWDQYESVAIMDQVCGEKNCQYTDFVKEKLYREYRKKQGDKAIQYINGDHKAYKPLKKPYKKSVDKWFYTDRQKEAIKDIENGVITIKTLCKFFEVKVPKKLAGNDENLAYKLSFRITTVQDGYVQFIGEKKKSGIENVKGKNPLVIFGYPKHKKDYVKEGYNYISVKNIKAFYRDISRRWRKRYDAKVVGITGSVGKTTTTEMIGCVMRKGFNTYKIEGNQNVARQIASFVFNLNPETEVFVQEASGAQFGLMEASSYILEPNYFVLTNIGNAHIGNFYGRQELLMLEKMALDRHGAKNAVGIINWDDPLLKKAPFMHKVVSFAIKDQSADFVAKDIVSRDGQIIFNVVEKRGVKTKVVINAFGEHNVLDALSAFALGVKMGMDRSRIAEALLEYKTKGIRQSRYFFGEKAYYLDCYNATLESMIAAMDAIGTISVSTGNKKVAVLGDMAALGDKEERIHREVGKMAAEKGTADIVVFYGEKMPFAMEECEKLGQKCVGIIGKEKLEEWIENNTNPGDLICFKASHVMNFAEIVDDLNGTDFYLKDDATMFKPRVQLPEGRFKVVEGFGAALLKATAASDVVTLPEKVEDEPLRQIGEKSFAESKVKKVEIPDTVKGISEKAFQNCIELEEINLPQGLLFIGENAFENCVSLRKIVIPDSVKTISDYAFAGCSSLTEVVLPKGVCTISEKAFDK